MLGRYHGAGNRYHVPLFPPLFPLFPRGGWGLSGSYGIESHMGGRGAKGIGWVAGWFGEA